MINLATLKKAARIVKDDKGEEVVQIPLPIWEELVRETSGSSEGDQPQQHERIRETLAKLNAEPDDKSPEWWNEFDRFLRENRFQIEERDLGFDE